MGQGLRGCHWEARDVESQACYWVSVAAAVAAVAVAAAGENHPLPVPLREDQILLRSPAAVPCHCCCSPLTCRRAGMMSLAPGPRNSHQNGDEIGGGEVEGHEGVLDEVVGC